MLSPWNAQRRQSVRAAAAIALACIAATAAAGDNRSPPAYALRNLVSNGAVDTPHHDANMVNTWGVSFNPNGLVWVTNNRTGTSTLYDGNGAVNPLVVKVPPAGASGTGTPTGIVFSATSDFAVTNGRVSGPSRFIFASDDGLISGWAPNVDLLNAIRVTVTPGAGYTGLAIANSSTGARLYAADYKGGRVDMFDGQFRRVTTAGAFIDPALPKKLKPFNVHALNNQIYVTYTREGSDFTRGGRSDGAVAASAADGAAAERAAKGAGNDASGGGNDADSVVAIFDTQGKYLRRAVAASTLKQPWGLALAPANFGKYSNRLLVGDFHDGTISAYDQNTGALLGVLSDARGQALKMPGLWGFQFGNGINAQPLNTLFFAAGPNGKGGGVYGSIAAVGD